MTRRTAAWATLLSGAALTVPAGPAWSQPAASCAGVTVVVDFGALGGGVQTRCAPGDPDTGLTALSAAGFSFGFVPRQPGMVCQVNGLPNPCNGAPHDAYWAYYHGSGGSWVYSDTGAGAYNPAPGTVDGWAFGAGRRPGVHPPLPQQPPAPPPNPPAPPPPLPTPPAASTAAVPSPSASRPATPPASSATLPAPESGPPSADTVPTAAHRADPGGLPWVVAPVLIGALAGLALWQRRRRRSAP